jgi:predicted nucleotidyltransferase
MNNPATQQIQVLKTVAKWADRFTCIRKIHVFGSFARGEVFSDIDIAVEYTTKDPSPECYTAVNMCSGELEEALRRIIPTRIGWTNIAVKSQGYDQKAWDAINSGMVIQCCGKAQLVWTKPKPKA